LGQLRPDGARRTANKGESNKDKADKGEADKGEADKNKAHKAKANKATPWYEAITDKRETRLAHLT
jgi:hypothetical protein